jgi:hypothetical protein
MPRTSSRSYDKRESDRVRVEDLTDAQIKCRGRYGHAWEDDPGANWHTPRYEYLHCYRYYSFCTRGCGVKKVAVYHKQGYFVTGFTRYPAQYRVTGIGRGAGRKPFIVEEIRRSQRTPTGRKRVSDKARRQYA